MSASLTFRLLLLSGLAAGVLGYGALVRFCLAAGLLCLQAIHSLCHVLGTVGVPDAAGLPVGLLLAITTLPGLVRLAQAGLTVARATARTAHLRVARVELPGDLAGTAARTGLAGRVVLVGDGGNAAFTFGLLRPLVYLSDALAWRLSPQELEAVLVHEAVHVRHRDPLRSAVSDLIGAALWFLPVLRDLQQHFVCQMEIEADSVAVEQVGRPSLAGALYKLLSTGVAAMPGPAAAALMTEARLSCLVDGVAPAVTLRRWRVLFSAMSVIAIACLLFV